MRAILVIVESYHDELWLDGRCDTGFGLLNVRVLILMLLLLVRLVIPCIVTLFPHSECLQYRGSRHNILRCPACVNVLHCCMVRFDALLSF